MQTAREIYSVFNNVSLTRDEPTPMNVPELCNVINANMTPLSNGTVHSLINLQTSFRAAELGNFLPQWETITTDPTILQFVSGFKIEFKTILYPSNII